LYTDMLMYSHGVGHAMAHMDCAMRAKELGAKWTLFLDLDEYLVPGANVSLSRAPTWDEFVADHPKETAFVFSALSVNYKKFARVFGTKREVCFCAEDFSASRFLLLERQRHIEEEFELAKPSDPWDCRFEALRYWTKCSDFHATRKLAIFNSPEFDFNPAGVGTHHLHECGEVSLAKSCKRNRRRALTVDPHLMYLRHYSCLNAPCEQSSTTQWWRDAKKTLRKVDHSREVLVGKPGSESRWEKNITAVMDWLERIVGNLTAEN
jgi:hypothetical protein